MNTIPSVLAVQELGEAMSEQGYGRIVIGSSIGVKFGGGIKSYCYSLTKFASELLHKFRRVGLLQMYCQILSESE